MVQVAFLEGNLHDDRGQEVADGSADAKYRDITRYPTREDYESISPMRDHTLGKAAIGG